MLTRGATPGPPVGGSWGGAGRWTVEAVTRIELV
ncbi:hypothetical protein SSCG_02331 [Streptomyces clavuligerus]|nr:hypothetical protein SSCG_02331 [Streptomyces clavuligerus]